VVDIERLLVALLRAHSDVAEIFEESIYVDLPQNASRPVCRVSQLGGLPDSSAQPTWLNRPSVDFDVWAVTKLAAFEAMSTVRLALLEAPRLNSVHELGELVYVSATFPAYLPDSDWPDDNGQPGPRYHMTTRITAHPTRS
jgi:hypothetical protein